MEMKTRPKHQPTTFCVHRFGHIWKCSGSTPGSVLRGSLAVLRKPNVVQRITGLVMCKANSFLLSVILYFYFCKPGLLIQGPVGAK